MYFRVFVAERERMRKGYQVSSSMILVLCDTVVRLVLVPDRIAYHCFVSYILNEPDSNQGKSPKKKRAHAPRIGPPPSAALKLIHSLENSAGRFWMKAPAALATSSLCSITEFHVTCACYRGRSHARQLRAPPHAAECACRRPVRTRVLPVISMARDDVVEPLLA